MDYIFRDIAELSVNQLAQGDVIDRTAEVDGCIGNALALDGERLGCTHLIVLTQSCDLAKRKGRFKAPHITLAAVRPFSDIMNQYLSEKNIPIEGTDFSYYPKSVEEDARHLIERHLNNTEDDFFFLPKSEDSNIPRDLLALLRVTVTIGKEHYETLAKAKIAELHDVFRAKLGWLAGNIYSRVATPDLEESGNAEHIKKSYYNQYISKEDGHWISELTATKLCELVEKERNKTGRDLDKHEVEEIYNRMQGGTNIVADSIVEELKRRELIDPSDSNLAKKFARAIAMDDSIRSLVKQSR